jgi:hypothetical protein
MEENKVVKEIFKSDSRRKNGIHRMSFGQRRFIQRMGGCAAHSKPKGQRCHEFNKESARAAALKRWACVTK